MTDLSSLSADQLAEKVRSHVVVLMHTHRLGREDDAHTVFEALAELCRRLNTAENALEQLSDLGPEGEETGFDCGRHDEPDHDHEFYFGLYDDGFCEAWRRAGNIARAVLADLAAEKEE